MSAALVALILTSVLATSFLSGIFGMVGGVILMGIFGAVLPVELALALHGASQLSANGSRCLTLLKHVDWRGCRYYFAGALISAAALWTVAFVPSRPLLFLFLGLMPFLTLIKSAPQLRFERPRDALFAGIVVTGAHLVAGVSGPLLDLFFVHSRESRFAVIATKALTQTLGHLLKLVYFGAALKAFDVPPSFIAAVVVMALLGTLCGGIILRRLSDTDFRTYTRRIVLLMGAVYLAKAAWAA